MSGFLKTGIVQIGQDDNGTDYFWVKENGVLVLKMGTGVNNTGTPVRSLTKVFARIYTANGTLLVPEAIGATVSASAVFTCPVDGLYLVTGLVVGTVVGRTVQNLLVNGANAPGFSDAEWLDTTSAAFGTSLNLSSSHVLNLTAGSTIQPVTVTISAGNVIHNTISLIG